MNLMKTYQERLIDFNQEKASPEPQIIKDGRGLLTKKCATATCITKSGSAINYKQFTASKSQLRPQMVKSMTSGFYQCDQQNSRAIRSNQFMRQRESSVVENETTGKKPQEVIQDNDFEGLKCRLYDGKRYKNNQKASFRTNSFDIFKANHKLYKQKERLDNDKEKIHTVYQDQVKINRQLNIVQRNIDDVKYFNEKIMNYNENRLKEIKDHEENLNLLRNAYIIKQSQVNQEYQENLNHKKRNKILLEQKFFQQKQLETLEQKLVTIEYDKHIYNTKLMQGKKNKS